MAWHLQQACITGDVNCFEAIVEGNVDLLDHKFQPSSDTTLHLVSRFGFVELVKKILETRTSLLHEKNSSNETPFHEACREGHVEVVKVMTEVDPTIVHRLNGEDESGLTLACRQGHTAVVETLLAVPKLLEVVGKGSLHAAAMEGHIDIVREIIKLRHDFTRRRDTNGDLPVHLASRRGHHEVVRELLKIDSQFCFVKDGNGCGKTPLQLAVTSGSVEVINEILNVRPDSVKTLTEVGESVLHLGVMNNQFDAVMYIVENMDVSEIIDVKDGLGRTALDIANANKLSKIVKLLEKQRNRGSVAVDTNTSNGRAISEITGQPNAAGGKRQLDSGLEIVDRRSSSKLKLDNINFNKLSPSEVLEIGKRQLKKQLNRGSVAADTNTSNGRTITTTLELTGRSSPGKEVLVPQFDPTCSGAATISEITEEPNFARGKTQVDSGLEIVDRRSSSKHKDLESEINMEGLRNARNTITIIAILIATVTFAAGMNPPGGVHQGEDVPKGFVGKSVAGRSTAFKIFIVSNEIALFSSLAIVIFLVSIVPSTIETMIKILVVTHKIMWASIAFMAVAYTAAVLVILPTSGETRWIFTVVLAIGGGTVGAITIWVSVVVVRHVTRAVARRRHVLTDEERSEQKRAQMSAEIRAKAGAVDWGCRGCCCRDCISFSY